MNSLFRTPRVLAVLVMILLVTGAAFAGDPPGRVMRLRYVGGQISMQPGGVNDWVEATVNRPLTTADRVWADKDSRAELSLGTATLRIKDETSMTISNLTDNTVQVELDQGTLNLRVSQMYPGEIYEIDTPNVAFTLSKPGDYRIEVDSERSETLVIVRKGEGEGTGDGRGVRVRSGEEVRFENGNTLMHSTASARGFDGFDDWCRTRDKREDSAESLRYVPADMVGYEDLDEHGYWRDYPGYGPVWVPRRVVADWAPYRYGHWVWMEPWGWTWVDDAPWGFAPFHYGRWVYVGGFWGWSPGPRHVRPVYAPALVAWVGGHNWGVGISLGGGVGWVPLGFGEAYYPSYRVSHNYVRNVNIANTRITNITNVTNNYTIINNGRAVNERYANQQVRGAVTMVPQNAFAGGRGVGGARLRLSDRDAASAPIARDAEVAPVRGSVLGAGQGRHAAAPPAGAVGKPVWAKEHPPERPVPFEQRRSVIERNGGRPLDDAQVNELRSQRGQGAGRATPNAAGAERQAPRVAAPELKGQTGLTNDSAGATQQRPGRSVPRPGADRTADQRDPGMRPSDRTPRAEGENRSVTPAAETPRSGGMRPSERVPRAETPETAPAGRSGSENTGFTIRDERRGVPRPPKSVDGSPQVTRSPQTTEDRPAPRVQNESGRGVDRNADRDRVVDRPAQQSPAVRPERPEKPERESRRQQNTDQPAARPPEPQRNSQPAVERPQRQPREHAPAKQSEPKQPKEQKNGSDKAPHENWRGR